MWRLVSEGRAGRCPSWMGGGESGHFSAQVKHSPSSSLFPVVVTWPYIRLVLSGLQPQALLAWRIFGCSQQCVDAVDTWPLSPVSTVNAGQQSNGEYVRYNNICVAVWRCFCFSPGPDLGPHWGFGTDTARPAHKGVTCACSMSAFKVLKQSHRHSAALTPSPNLHG